jgi:hypothetical protein
MPMVSLMGSSCPAAMLNIPGLLTCPRVRTWKPASRTDIAGLPPGIPCDLYRSLFFSSFGNNAFVDEVHCREADTSSLFG